MSDLGYFAGTVMPASVFYRGSLAVLAIVGFYTGFLNYESIVGTSSIRPAWWIVTLSLLALPLALSPNAWRRILATPLTGWCVFYAVVTIMWFMASSQSDMALNELIARLLSTAFLGVLVVVFADRRVHNASRWAILASVLVGVLLNAYDLSHPLLFSPILGRAAGLYLNPNISGAALVVGMVASVGVLPPKVRPWYVLTVGVGVLLTLSRGGLLSWILATGVMFWPREVKASTILRAFGFGGILVFSLVALIEGRQEVGQVAEDGASRAAEVLRFSQVSADYSIGFRKETAATAWEMFSERPFVGRGVGSTVEWDVDESTHNIVLRDLAEYGLVGALLFPLFVVAIVSRGRGEDRRYAVALGSVLIVWGMVSHNVLDERHFLIAAALVSLMAGTSERADRENEDATLPMFAV